MIFEATLNKYIRDIVNLILEESDYTIAAKQDAPRPVGPYATVDFVSDTGVGLSERTYANRGTDLDLDITHDSLRDVMFSINFYRDVAIDNARWVHLGLVRESVLLLLTSANIGLIRRSEVREISEALENGWEERAQMDIFLSIVGTDTEVMRTISSVDIAGQFEARDLIYNFNIEV